MEVDDALASDIVEEGEEDYLDISTIAYLYKLEHNISREQLDPLATEIAAELIRRDLIVPGVLDDGFRPWRLTSDESVAMLRRDVQLALRDSPMLSHGQVCWFDITDKAKRTTWTTLRDIQRVIRTQEEHYLRMYSKRLLDWVLELGEDDEIQLADIYHFTLEDAETRVDIIRRTIDVTVQLTRDGVITPGDIVDHEFTPWTVDMDTVEHRIRERSHRALQEAGRFLPGDVCWFRTNNYEG